MSSEASPRPPLLPWLALAGTLVLLAAIAWLLTRDHARQLEHLEYERLEATTLFTAAWLDASLGDAGESACLADPEASICDRWLRELNPPENLSVAIFDADHRLVARRPAVPEALGVVVDHPVTRAFSAGTDRAVRFRDTSPLDGGDRFYVAWRMERTPLYIVIGTPTIAYRANLRERAILTIAGYLILAVFAFLLMWRAMEALRLRDAIARSLSQAREAHTALQSESRQRATSEREALRRSADQTLVARLARSLLDTTGVIPDGDEAVQKALEADLRRIALHFDMDRCTILFTDDDYRKIVAAVQTTIGNAPPTLDILPGVDLDLFPALRRDTLGDGCVHIHDVLALPNSRGGERIGLTAMGSRVLHMRTIVVRERIVGSLVLDRVERLGEPLDDQAIALLEPIADLLGSALTHIEAIRTLRESERRFRTLFDGDAAIAIQSFGPDGTIRSWNRGSERLYGYPPDAVIGTSLYDYLLTDEARERTRTFFRNLVGDEDVDPVVDFTFRDIHGHVVHVRTYHTVFRPTSGPPEIYAIDMDLTRVKQLELQLREQATTDELTGLWNRRYFTRRAQRELAMASRTERPLCVLMLDIDHFKRINDTRGHGVGDRVLRDFGALLRDQLRATDLLGRLGGEEFAVLLPETGLGTAEKVAERIRAAVEDHSFEHDEGTLRATVSIGIAQRTPENDKSLDRLLSQADQALYEAKAGGRNRVVVQRPTLV
ncbi:MAG: diguanylate cyclase [Deltaproteobacteria bacterium]|nr:MAG: diguanylate cyclase [Deltaproteobacteria bacterium]